MNEKEQKLIKNVMQILQQLTDYTDELIKRDIHGTRLMILRMSTEKILLKDVYNSLKILPELLSYHINGTSKREGLDAEGLIHKYHEDDGQVSIIITELGKIILKKVDE